MTNDRTQFPSTEGEGFPGSYVEVEHEADESGPEHDHRMGVLCWCGHKTPNRAVLA
jgi:hypothetical protein